jgi:hypothetical protein
LANKKLRPDSRAASAGDPSEIAGDSGEDGGEAGLAALGSSERHEANLDGGDGNSSSDGDRAARVTLDHDNLSISLLLMNISQIEIGENKCAKYYILYFLSCSKAVE